MWRKMAGTGAIFDDGQATKATAGGVEGWYQSHLAQRAIAESLAPATG